ncbi:MAG TPA: hypothetical protein VE865_01310 [Bradyrhizobium sp.]|nr:hypothetical protein [Bradyrhizobium sp.]
MSESTNDSLDRDVPARLAEPDLAAWAEKVALRSSSPPRLWYGAALFWFVVICIVAARVMFLDVSSLRPTTASTAPPSMLAGSAPQPSHGARL